MNDGKGGNCWFLVMEVYTEERDSLGLNAEKSEQERRSKKTDKDTEGTSGDLDVEHRVKGTSSVNVARKSNTIAGSFSFKNRKNFLKKIFLPWSSGSFD